VKADPMFVAPGSGGTSLLSLHGYQIRPESPCIGGGLPIPNPGTRDFFGNPLPSPTSLGVYEPKR
jgi:hypothetical protein